MRCTIVGAVVCMLVLSGCARPPPDEGVPPGQAQEFVVDSATDAPSPWNLLGVALVNLNGSFVVHLLIDNITFGTEHPFYQTTIAVETSVGSTRTLRADLLFTPGAPPPATRPRGGVVEADGIRWFDVCQTERVGDPAEVFHELAHADTGLIDGGTVTRVDVVVTDHEGTVYDQGTGTGRFVLRPGDNPYTDPDSNNPGRLCPLLADPASPQRVGEKG